MLIPGGPGLAKGVTLSIIDSETWSGKPEPGTRTPDRPSAHLPPQPHIVLCTTDVKSVDVLPTTPTFSESQMVDLAKAKFTQDDAPWNR
jgi:hypothetical protein